MQFVKLPCTDERCVKVQEDDTLRRRGTHEPHLPTSLIESARHARDVPRVTNIAQDKSVN
jgi:hypothetical protein